MWGVYLIIVAFISYCSVIRSQFFDCYDDPGFEPDEGTLSKMQFTWLGALQYIHVKYGRPHYFRVPRVVLVSRQFVLSTAVDAAEVPDGYALGNIVFSDYERDEKECGLSIHDIAEGLKCDPALLIIPISDVLLHPEYKNFGFKHSVALLKMIIPVKSNYMLPVCLPSSNFLEDENGRRVGDKFLHVDFLSDVLRDFVEEEKEVVKIRLLPKEVCYINDSTRKETKMNHFRMVCTTGCGYHSGAPTVIHEHTGHWSLVMMAIGGSQCPDPLRTSRFSALPYHITIYPYVTWITTAITGTRISTYSKNDPFGYIMPRVFVNERKQKHVPWIGHWWLRGIRCYDRGEAARDLFRFYHDVFQLIRYEETIVTYLVEINAPQGFTIACVKVGMPFRYGNPTVWELNTASVKIRIPLITMKNEYKFQVEAWAHKALKDSEETKENELTLTQEEEYGDLNEFNNTH